MTLEDSLSPLLNAVEQLPAVDVRVDHARRAAEVRVATWVIARIDLARAHLLVTAPADTIATLQGLFPTPQPTPGGLAFDVVDPRVHAEALGAIRRRAGIQRFIWQLRVSSP